MNEEMLRVLLLHENEKIIKGEPYDKEIVGFCNDELFERQRLFTDEDFVESKKQLFEILHGKRKHISPLSKIKAKRRIFKPISIGAACIILIFCVQVTSLAAGGNFFSSVSQWSNNMIKMIMGREIHQEDFSVSGKKSRVYKEIDEFTKQEGVDVFIPQSIQGSMLNQILYSVDGSSITLSYHENKFGLTINLNEDDSGKYFNRETDLVYSHNNIDYYINPTYNSIKWVLDNDLYVLICDFDISNSAEEIINSLK